MNNTIRKVLEKLEQNGFEAYVVGGYVRDYLLGIETTDVDICTNALPKDIIHILPKANTENYGSVAFKIGKYNFDITTYRSEENYDKRRPTNINYVDNLLIDIKRRDFTMNALCMNSIGTIIDLLNGKSDVENHKIRVIGDISKKFTEDPLRIMRAIRFAITLDFELDDEIIKFINYHKDLINTLSYFRKMEELNKIFSSKNVAKGLILLKELDLLDVLEINYNENIVIGEDVLGIWSQIEFSDKYPFNKNSKEIINKIRKITAKGVIDNLTLFNYNLHISAVAGAILGINRSEITKMHASLLIKDIKELNVTTKDIIELLNLRPSPKIKIIMQDVIEKVLNDKLRNEYDIIKEYLIEKWK